MRVHVKVKRKVPVIKAVPVPKPVKQKRAPSERYGNVEMGAVLRDRRDELDMTLVDVADKAGVSAPMLSMIETGRRWPADDVRQRLCQALRLDPGKLRAYQRGGVRGGQPARRELFELVAGLLHDGVMPERITRQLTGLRNGGAT